jgi:hypothetical protein
VLLIKVIDNRVSCITHHSSILTRDPLLLQILSPLLTPPLGLLNPLVIRAITLVQFRLDHALQQFANESDEIMPAQTILPEPLRSSVFLVLELLLVANLAGPDAQVAHAGEQVEADFGARVALDAALQDGNDLVRELRGGAGAMGDGGGLEAVEFVECVVY